MTTRRGGRSSHVRPRPPSGGRSAPVKVRPRPPASGRLPIHTPIQRGGGVPIVARLLLLVAVVAMAAAILYVGAGGLASAAGAVGSTLTGFVKDLTTAPTPAPSPPSVSDPPTIASPAEPYTNAGSVDLVVTVPTGLAGNPDYRLRVRLALEDQAPATIQEVPVGPTPRTVIPVVLTKGINDFTVTIVGPGGESESSALVRYVLDQTSPSIKLTSPKDGATINRQAVVLLGKTQGRSTLIARNAANGSSIVGTADADGVFSLSIPLATGTNALRIAATDPAGNSKTMELSVRRGTGELSASLKSSIYRIRRPDLPRAITLTATVTDPDGKALAGARVTFTLSVPGIASVTADELTGSNGRAVWNITIPRGADVGSGSAGVLAVTDSFGTVRTETSITITK
ncbi:MAG: Ig-like domain-containing protein [Candidatus Limnocylindrales bacterium]